jgi:hypothetical protein
MRRNMRRQTSFGRGGTLIWLSLAAMSVIGLSLPGCVAKECTLIGCQSGATLSLALPADVVIPEGAIVTACFNDRCAVGTVPIVPAAGGSSQAISFASGFVVHGTVWPPDAPHDRIEVFISAEGTATSLRAGDRYSLALADSIGAVIAAKDQVAAGYDEFNPNGPGCGPGCYEARFR